MINARPMIRKMPRLLSDVVDLNISMPPANPRNNIAAPPITKLVASPAPVVISGKKTPESSAKIAIK